MDGLTIGRLARESGVGVETIRFYERRGLIEQPERPRSGYRKYSPETAARVKFIRNAKELGFSLREISELLALEADTEGGRVETRARTEAKIVEIDGRIASLRGLKRHLKELVETCRSGRRACRCPIMDTMKQERRRGTPRPPQRKE
jgi:MerR family copper efflux transcriptional regulator